MKTQSYYVWMVLVYLFIGSLIAFLGQPLVALFSVVVLLFFQITWAYLFQLRFENDIELLQNEMNYMLSKTKQTQTQTQTEFLSLSENLGSGLLVVDEQGIIKEVNHFVLNSFNFSTMKNQHYELFKFHKSLYMLILNAYLNEKEVRGQIIHNQRYFDIVSTPLFEQSNYRGCLILFHDITQIKHAESFQKQFTADVSHELKTPLSALKGISEILLRDNQISSAQQREFYLLMHNETARLETILSDLLIIAKMDRLDYELAFKKVQIKPIIEQSIQLLTPQINDKKISVKYDIQASEVEIDMAKMQQVFVNLIKNAINYTDQGTITISGYTDGKCYHFSVKDTGIGIAESDHDLIFKRFYRVDNDRSRASGGSGLGLSIIKNVVQKHHGTITLVSSPNQGSTFRISIPITQH